MTNTVKGAGRKKAARLAAKHEPVVGARKGAPILPRSSAQAPGKPAPPISKAQALANDLEAAGFDVERKKLPDGSKQVIAKLHQCTITATWTPSGTFVYPGTLTNPEGSIKIRNASEARRFATACADGNPPKTKPAKATKSLVAKPSVVTARVTSPKPAGRPVNPPSAGRPAATPEVRPEPTESDEEILSRLRGGSITWVLPSGKKRRTKFTKDERHLQIAVGKSDGRRYLTFADDDGFHTRALAEIEIS